MTTILSDSTVSQSEDDIHDKLTQAYNLLQLNQNQRAIQMYKKIIKQHPRVWKTYQNLGVTYIMSKRYEEAYQILKFYVQQAPKDPLGHDSLGVTESELDYPLLAIASFINSINIAPDFYMPYYNLGVVLSKIGLFDYAQNVYSRCLQLQPDYYNAMNNIADIHKKKGNIQQAIMIFSQIIQLDPTYILAVKNLGNCYLGKNDYYNALLHYIKYLEDDPHKPEVFRNLAICLNHFQMYELAKTYIIRSVQAGSISSFIQREFMAADLLFEEVKKLYFYIRGMLKIKSDNIPTEQLKRLKYLISSASLIYFQIVHNCKKYSNTTPKEVLVNQERLIFNAVGFMLKLGIGKFKLLYESLTRRIKQLPQMVNWILKKKQIAKQIYKWSRYIRHIYRTTASRNLSLADEYYLKEKLAVHKIFKQKYYSSYKDGLVRKIIKKSFISRSYCHSYKRLILKRVRLIKKYKKFNKGLGLFFRIKPFIKTISYQDHKEQSKSE